jgi:predicted deacylase
LLVFGAIHGNETCGTKAIDKVIAEIKSGKLTLQKGSVTFVPIANPVAYVKNVRYVEENLNRIFKVTKKPRSIEAKLANDLCQLIKRCDVFLDIHSTTAKGKPFIYLDFPIKANRRFAKVLGPAIAVTGWPELYQKSDKAHLSYDTTTYAAKQGKDCLLIECGQHEAASAPIIAYKAILNSLCHYGLIKGKAKSGKFTEVKMTAGYFRQSAQDHLAKKWQHLDRVRKGDPLILKTGGGIVRAPYDAFIIMPKATAGVGDDWLYLGKRTGKT